jgi:heat shock protein HslJ
MKSLNLLLPLVCVFFMMSCGPTQVATSSNPMYERDVLYDNSWDLIELNGTTIARTGDRYSYITFTPGANTISGYTSCNQIGGTIAFKDANGLTFSPTVTTKNVCTDNRVDVSLVPALRNVDKWAVVDDNLVMYDDGKIVARWAPSGFTNEDLYGNWQLAYVSDTDMPFDVLYPVDKRPTIVFAADKKDVIHGTTGYNTINCPVKMNGLGITFEDCTSTKIACEGPGESMFMDNLKSINHYRLTDDNTLVMVTDDNQILRFKRL